MATIVIDNGAGTVRGGFAGQALPHHSIENCLAKHKNNPNSPTLIGESILKSHSSHLKFKRPHDKGYLIDWEAEIEIWNVLFDSKHMKVNNYKDHKILFTEPPFAPTVLSQTTNEVIFEEFGFNACYRCPSSALSVYQEQVLEDEKSDEFDETLPGSDAIVVVDMGFSFSHVYCYYKGRAIQPATVRLNVGGKLMTNYLSEVLSYRQLNVLEDFQLVTKAKEALSFVSLDFDKDMISTRRKSSLDQCSSSILREYVLPDYKNIKQGYVRNSKEDDEIEKKILAKGEELPQVLKLENERFAIPEILIHPTDIGIKQAGIPECIVQSIKKCPVFLQPILSGNVLLTGGCSKIPGMQERIQLELRALVPSHAPVNVRIPQKDPDLHAWKGGSMFAKSKDFSNFYVSKEDYEEYGHRVCDEKFIDW